MKKIVMTLAFLALIGGVEAKNGKKKRQQKQVPMQQQIQVQDNDNVPYALYDYQLVQQSPYEPQQQQPTQLTPTQQCCNKLNNTSSNAPLNSFGFSVCPNTTQSADYWVQTYCGGW